jgi:hypothetical protein
MMGNDLIIPSLFRQIDILVLLLGIPYESLAPNLLEEYMVS